MCGITGWIDWETDLTEQRSILEKMTETLVNRGPDASGIWMSPQAAFGHRRLSVVDLEGGKQPMIRQLGDCTYVITYNGELYNTPEIRRELESRGHQFYTNSDTEVLLVSYIEWGPACVDFLNGIFAFGIWNTNEQSLFLARDRLGVKPLFYTERHKSFFFGSELKALLAHPDVPPEIDLEGISEIFALGPSRTPGHGVFRGVRELRPGYCLLHNRNGTRIWQYWSLESKPHEDDLETTIAKVQELLGDAAKRQLVSDVPICTLLSGGLDSSALTAFAANSLKKEVLGPLHTYSVDYVDNDIYFKPSHFQPNSDAAYVKLMSDTFQTEHHSIIIDTPQLVDALKAATIARDLPGMADVDSSLYLFCKEIKKGATVVLSGECADEVFGGYPWFHSERALAYNSFPWARSVEERTRVLSPELVNQINPAEYVDRRYRETLAEVPVLPGEDPLEARRREMFYLNITWFMTTLLDRKDRMSMASGLEVRVPFCDHRLVEYVWNIPWKMKSCDQREKGILRRALRGVLPEEIITRRKSPYPKTHNPNYLSAVRNWLQDILNDSNSPLTQLINVETVKKMVQSPEGALKAPWFGQLMTDPQFFAYLIQMDLWLREYGVIIR